MIQSIEMSDRAFAYQWIRTLLITLVKPNEQHAFPSQETRDALLSNDDETWIQGFADGYSYTISSDFSWISFSPFFAREETLEGQHYDDGWNTGFACACHDKHSLLGLGGKAPPIDQEKGRVAASSVARSSATPPFPDRILACTNFFGTTAVTGFEYAYDLLGRPVRRNDDAFAYDTRGQVVANCYDNLGNVVAYVDESGTKVASYTYDAFGYAVSSSGSMSDTFPHRFSTKWQDNYTGLYD